MVARHSVARRRRVIAMDGHAHCTYVITLVNLKGLSETPVRSGCHISPAHVRGSGRCAGYRVR